MRELSALTTPFTSRLVPKANASDLLSMWDQVISCVPILLPCLGMCTHASKIDRPHAPRL